MTPKARKILIFLLVLILLSYHELYVGYTYQTERSKNKRFRVVYDEVFPYVRAFTVTMPGDGGQPAIGWVRLYNSCGDKIKEKFTWQLASATREGGKWLKDKLIFLGEVNIIWKLPEKDCS